MKFNHLLMMGILIGALFVVAPVHAEDAKNPTCAVFASTWEQIARDRDAGKSEASAHADVTGGIDNKIITLIYQTHQYSPAQEKAAVFKVCDETDGFMHGVGVPDNASIDKIDASILQAIRVQLMQH